MFVPHRRFSSLCALILFSPWGPCCHLCPSSRRPKPVSAPPRATQAVPPSNWPVSNNHNSPDRPLCKKNKETARTAAMPALAIAFHPSSPALFPHAVRTKPRRSRAPAHEAFESRANSTHGLVTRDYKIPFYRCHSQVTPHGAAQGIKHAQQTHVQTRSPNPPPTSCPHFLTPTTWSLQYKTIKIIQDETWPAAIILVI